MAGLDLTRKRKDRTMCVIYHLYEYLLSTYCKAESILQAGDTMVIKEAEPVCRRLTRLWRDGCWSNSVWDACGPVIKKPVPRISFPEEWFWAESKRSTGNGKTRASTWAEAPKMSRRKSFGRKELSCHHWSKEKGESGTRWGWRGSYSKDPGLHLGALGKRFTRADLRY